MCRAVLETTELSVTSAPNVTSVSEDSNADVILEVRAAVAA